jgi:integrator complex subunit 4
MNMRVREAAFRVLGEATRIHDSVLLQTLTKKVAKAPKETDASVSVPTIAQDGETGSPNFEEGANLLDASAAGAFVHGLEDEFLEVNLVTTLQHLCRLTFFGTKSRVDVPNT